MRIQDLEIRGGYWMALMVPAREADEQIWLKVSDLLKKPKFTIKSELMDDTGSAAMYLT